MLGAQNRHPSLFLGLILPPKSRTKKTRTPWMLGILVRECIRNPCITSCIYKVPFSTDILGAHFVGKKTRGFFQRKQRSEQFKSIRKSRLPKRLSKCLKPKRIQKPFSTQKKHHLEADSNLVNHGYGTYLIDISPEVLKQTWGIPQN